MPGRTVQADGKELFCAAGSRLMAADIKVSSTHLEAGAPRPFFEAPFATGSRNILLPSQGGLRFVTILQMEQPADLSITVGLNWMSRLEQ